MTGTAAANRLAGSIFRLSRILLAFAVVLAGVQVLPSGQRIVAAASPCVEQGPLNGSFVAQVCFTNPLDGSIFGSAPFSANVEVTAVSGTMPTVQQVTFYFTKSTSSSHSTMLADYASPWGLEIPSSRWIAGSYRLEALVRFVGGYATQTYASVIVTLNNGVSVAPHSNGTWQPATSGGSSITVAALGDGAGGLSGANSVGNLVSGMNPDLLLYLGDVYNTGTYSEFYNYYDPTLGALKSRTNPVPGNHEQGNNYVGYMDYWNSNQHYYSFNSGGWHFIALDSTERYGQTAVGTAQYTWLTQELQATSPGSCTLVYFHHPRWGLVATGGSSYMQDIWALMANQGVDVVLNGHEHNYQRWQPMDASGQPAAGGIHQFVIGTGGHDLQGSVLSDSRVARRVVADGALKLNLGPSGGSSSFIGTTGQTLDSSSFNCDGSAVTPPVPEPPDSFTLEANADAMVSELQPTTNYGTTTSLGTDSSPREISYFRFDVQGLSRPVQQAVLRLWVRDTSTNPPGLAVGSPSSWIESTITWNNRPSTGPPSSYAAYTGAGTWIEYDVTALVQNNGPLTFALIPQSTDSLKVNSRENSSNDPQLVISQVASPAASPAPATPTTSATPATPIVPSPTATATVPPATPIVPSPTATETATATATATVPPATPIVPSPTATETATATVPPATPIVPSPTATETATATATATVPPATPIVPSPTATETATATSTAEPVPTIPPGPGLTLEPVADALVAANAPTTNYGTSSSLRSDGNPNESSYLRFNVQGIEGPVTSARIRLWVRDGTVDAPYITSSSDTSWAESAITWDSRPASGGPVGNLGAVSSNTWIEYDVTSLVASNGLLTLVLVAESGDALSVNSRNNTTNRPQLIVSQSASVNTPTTTVPATVTPSPTVTATATVTTVPGPTQIPGQSLTLEPVADALVASSNPTMNYGTLNALRADNSPLELSYIRFNIQGVTGTITQATLRLWVRDGTVDAPSIAASSDTSWSESGITWNSRPAYGNPASDLGAVATGTWIEYDVTSLASTNGLVTLVLVSQSTDALSVNSRNNTSNRPQLVIGQTSSSITPTPTVEPTVPPPGSAKVFTAAADARVEEVNPSINYGASSVLRADGGTDPDVETFVRFTVSGVTTPIDRAILRLFVPATTNAGSVGGPSLYATTSSDWPESGIIWSNRPGQSGSSLGTLGSVAAGTWVEIDVSSVVTGNGSYGFVWATTSSDATDFSSRETSNQPQLVINGSAASLRMIAPTASSSEELKNTPTATPTSESGSMQPATPIASDNVAKSPAASPIDWGKAKVTGTGPDGLFCRVSPLDTADVITKLDEGTQITLRGPSENGWSPVRCADTDGFVSSIYIVIDSPTQSPTDADGTSGLPLPISPTAEAAIPDPTATIEAIPTATVTPTLEPAADIPTVLGTGYITGTNGDGLRCRTAPTSEADIITVLPDGRQVLITGAEQDGWLPVICLDGVPGFVSSEFVADKPAAPADLIPTGTSTAETSSEPTATIPEVPEPVATEAIANDVPYAIVDTGDTENSGQAWYASDNNPDTYWSVYPAISPTQTRLYLDLGQVLPIDSMTIELAVSGMLPNFEIWLSEDAETWYDATGGVNGWSFETDYAYEISLGFDARYIRIVIPNVDEQINGEVGGIRQIDIVPGDFNATRYLSSLGEPTTPTPEPEPEMQLTDIPAEEPIAEPTEESMDGPEPVEPTPEAIPTEEFVPEPTALPEAPDEAVKPSEGREESPDGD